MFYQHFKVAVYEFDRFPGVFLALKSDSIWFWPVSSMFFQHCKVAVYGFDRFPGDFLALKSDSIWFWPVSSIFFQHRKVTVDVFWKAKSDCFLVIRSILVRGIVERPNAAKIWTQGRSKLWGIKTKGPFWHTSCFIPDSMPISRVPFQWMGRDPGLKLDYGFVIPGSRFKILFIS